MSDTREQMLEILRGLHPEVEFEEEQHLINDGILDSFDIVSMISEMLDTFDVEVTTEYIVPENFNSLDALVHMVDMLIEEE